MAAFFDAPRVKVLRAREHIAELAAHLSAFAATNPVRFETTVEQRGDMRMFVWKVHIQSVPLKVSAILGDAVHNLRAALDFAAADAARANGQPADDVYFPICDDAEFLPRMIARRKFERAGAGAVALLMELRPYRGGNAALRALHDLDIQDKHMALIPSTVSASGPVVRMWDDDGTHNPTLIGDPSQPTDLRFVFPPGSALDGKEVLPALKGLAEMVERIIEAFAALYPAAGDGT